MTIINKAIIKITWEVVRMNLIQKKVGMVLLMILLISAFNPLVIAYAGDSRDGFDDIEITVGENGQLDIVGDAFSSDRGKAWNDLILRYKGFIAGISGIGTVTMILLFIFQFLKLGSSAGNPKARTEALVGVLWTGIAAAGLGAVTIIVGFFYRAI